MEKKKILYVIISLIIACLIVFVIVYNSKPVEYNSVEIPADNKIMNNSSRPYLDTIVAIGMSKLSIDSCRVIIRDMPEDLSNNSDRGTGGMDLKATVFESGGTYFIYVNKSVSKSNAIEVIAHEIIHLEQFWSGRLIVLNKSGLVNWEGEQFETLQIDYNSRPWEIEAFREDGELSSLIEEVLVKKD